MGRSIGCTPLLACPSAQRIRIPAKTALQKADVGRRVPADWCGEGPLSYPSQHRHGGMWECGSHGNYKHVQRAERV
jgi:hypothetical protein